MRRQRPAARVLRALVVLIAGLAAPGNGAWPQALEFSGCVEYLLSYGSLNASALNPGNMLGIDRYSGYLEGRATLAAGMDQESRAGVRTELRYRYNYLAGHGEMAIDQAYLLVRPIALLQMRAGRQRIGFGTGYLWSAVNNLDIARDPYTPGKYTQGIDALRGTLDLATVVSRPLSLSVEAVLPPDYRHTPLSQSTLGVQAYALFGMVEVGAAVSYRARERNPDDMLAGAYGSVDIAGFILGIEGSLSRRGADTSALVPHRTPEFRPIAVLSLNRRVSSNSFAVLEYSYNDHNLSGTDLDTLVARTRASPESTPDALAKLVPGQTGKHNAFATVSRDFGGHVTSALSVLVRFDRPGGFVYPQVSWNAIDNLTVTLEGLVTFTGGQRNEYSLGLYNLAASLRAQYFF